METLNARSARIDVEYIQRLVILHLQYMRVPADEQLWGTHQNAALMEENWSKGTKHAMKPLREMPGLFYKEMCEAGALGFIQSAPVPLRALYDRALLNDPHTTFDNLPEVCDIKLDEHQYKIIKQMVKERRNFWLEFDIRNHFKLGPVKYHNVVASIKGTKYPDEYVIISGHLDSYDVATVV